MLKLLPRNLAEKSNKLKKEYVPCDQTQTIKLIRTDNKVQNCEDPNFEVMIGQSFQKFR